MRTPSVLSNNNYLSQHWIVRRVCEKWRRIILPNNITSHTQLTDRTHSTQHDTTTSQNQTKMKKRPKRPKKKQNENKDLNLNIWLLRLAGRIVSSSFVLSGPGHRRRLFPSRSIPYRKRVIVTSILVTSIASFTLHTTFGCHGNLSVCLSILLAFKVKQQEMFVFFQN